MKLSFLLTQDLNSPSSLGRFFPLAKELAKLDNQIRILTLHSNFSEIVNKEESIEGVNVTYLGQMQVLKIGNEKKYFKPIKFIFLMSRATIKFLLYSLFGSYDVLYVGKPHPMNGLAGFVGKVLRSKKLVVDCDDLESSVNHFQNKWQRKIISFFEDKLPLYADIVLTNTYFSKKRLLSIGVLEENILIMPNGIDQDRFIIKDFNILDNLKNEMNLKDKKVVGYIGTLSLISHPIEILLEAVEILKTQISNVHLIIVGGGEDVSYIKQRIFELEIIDNVSLIGRIEPNNIPNYYKICDVTVDPVYDNAVAKARLPIKMFESWMAGVPFVTSDVGDRKMYLHDPICGLVAQGDKADALAKEIYRILSDVQLAKIIVENGLKKSKMFYWDVLSQDFISFLNERINQ